MASKRDRKVAFADDVDIENKKARSGDQPRSVKRSERYIAPLTAHGSLNTNLCGSSIYLPMHFQRSEQLLSESTLY